MSSNLPARASLPPLIDALPAIIGLSRRTAGEGQQADFSHRLLYLLSGKEKNLVGLSRWARLAPGIDAFPALEAETKEGLAEVFELARIWSAREPPTKMQRRRWRPGKVQAGEELGGNIDGETHYE